MKNKISTVIITLNEADNIARCINSVKKVSEDIVIIDAFSNDDTVKIAEELGARVFIKKWIGYGQNKNFGNDQALNDWILSVDADEILDDKLVDSINTTELQNNSIYSMINQLNYCGHWVRFTDWHPSYKKRLFNKTHTKWNTDHVHEGLIIHNDSIFNTLIGKILHYGYTSFNQLENKTERYARLSAKKLFENQKKIGFIKYIFGPTFRFLKSYIFQLGILDGKAGFHISSMNARLVRLRYKYLKEMNS